MEYVALLRGINVGKHKWIDMKRLKALFESLGYENVSTYINSGNVRFESNEKQRVIGAKIASSLKKEFDFEIGVLVKTKKQMEEIATAIPNSWKNDTMQRTDVAYLFEEIDSKETLAKIPVKKEYVDIRYTKGAIYWNLDRKNLNKCRLNKLISHPAYKLMTIRNVNTARFLAGKK